MIGKRRDRDKGRAWGWPGMTWCGAHALDMCGRVVAAEGIKGYVHPLFRGSYEVTENKSSIFWRKKHPP